VLPFFVLCFTWLFCGWQLFQFALLAESLFDHHDGLHQRRLAGIPPPFRGQAPFVLVYQQSCQRAESWTQKNKYIIPLSTFLFRTFASVFVYLSGQVSTLWFLDHLRYWNIFRRRGEKNRETERYNHFSWLFVVRALQFPFLRLSLLLIYSVFTQFVCAIAFVIVFPLPHGKRSFLQFSSNPFETGENCLGARFSNYGLCVSQV